MFTRTIGRIRKLASHATEGFCDQTHEVKRKILSFAKVLRRRTSQFYEDVNRITKEVVDITQSVLNQAQTVVNKLQKSKRNCVEAPKHVLQQAIDKTSRLLEQAKQVVGGNRIIKDRIISIHDSDARPIKKGKLAKPTEFGYKVRIDETESGFVTGCQVYKGNPSDGELLLSAVLQHIQTFGSAPHVVATDCGFGSRRNETALKNEIQVKHISTPFRGKKSNKRAELEKELWYKNLQRFRATGEAKIGLLKRNTD